MMFVKNDIISNIIPIIIKIDTDEYLIPAMGLAQILEINDNSIITVLFKIPNIDIKLLVDSKHFKHFMFAMRN